MHLRRLGLGLDGGNTHTTILVSRDGAELMSVTLEATVLAPRLTLIDAVQ